MATTNNLFPVFDVPSALAEDVRIEKKYRQAPLFDFETGDFVIDGSGRALYGSGYDAWVLWCIKTIMTQRWAHLGYGGNAGIEAVEAFALGDRAAVESAFERTVTEALLADPMGRTRYVNGFSFDWQADSLFISCVVTGDDGNSATVKAKIPKGRE